MFPTGKIVQLSQRVINRISAGEVIHQPCNVVKELLENSLDAGSTRISISLENGGFKKIKINDNGCGIALLDLPMACQRHATSKIRDFNDLTKITTFVSIIMSRDRGHVNSIKFEWRILNTFME